MPAVLIQRRDGASAATPLSVRHLELYRPDRPTARTTGRATARPTARPVGRPAPRPAPRPTARPTGRRLAPAVYRRRRLLAAGLLLLSLAAALILAQLVQAGIGGGPLTATGAAAGPGMVRAGAAEYVVRRGDTLWSIAASLEPGRDPRPMVDALAHEIGGSALYPGEAIAVPASS